MIRWIGKFEDKLPDGWRVDTMLLPNDPSAAGKVARAWLEFRYRMCDLDPDGDALDRIEKLISGRAALANEMDPRGEHRLGLNMDTFQVVVSLSARGKARADLRSLLGRLEADEAEDPATRGASARRTVQDEFLEDMREAMRPDPDSPGIKDIQDTLRRAEEEE